MCELSPIVVSYWRSINRIAFIIAAIIAFAMYYYTALLQINVIETNFNFKHWLKFNE